MHAYEHTHTHMHSLSLSLCSVLFIQIRLFEPHSVSVFWDSAVASVNVSGNDVRPAGWLLMHLERAAGNWGSIILTLFTEIYKCIHERVKSKERESKRERETFRIWESENCECRHFFSRKSFSHMPLKWKRWGKLQYYEQQPRDERSSSFPVTFSPRSIYWSGIRWQGWCLLLPPQVTGVKAGYPGRMWSSASWREDLWWASHHYASRWWRRQLEMVPTPTFPISLTRQVLQALV